MPGPSVVVLHAYSRGNRGDGYLVDLTLRLLAERGIVDHDVAVVASDRESFVDLPHVVSVPFGDNPRRARNVPAYLGVAAALLRSRVDETSTWCEVRELIATAKLVVGVGGGYLRGGTVRAAAKSSLVHLPQLVLAARSGVRTIYLPQSIGPFLPPVRRLVHGELARLDTVFVRDDRTAEELASLPNVHRMPDLAVLALAEDEPGPREHRGGVVFVGRELAGARRYLGRIEALLAATGAKPALQSAGRGNDDLSFYRRLSITHGVAPLQEAIAEGAPAVVIAVRLHAALDAIRLGVPAIHLSYERKGWGAFSDLHLDPYLHNAFSFDPNVVAKQADALAEDATEYWQRLSAALPRVRSLRAPLDDAFEAAVPRRIERGLVGASS